jgi:hypothetical protein
MSLKPPLFVPLAASLALAGCGGGPKTPLTQEQFAEIQANCNLGGASFGSSSSTSTSTETNPDGSTYTITTEVEGSSPDETRIVLPEGMSDSDVGRAIACLRGEFDRLGAEATVQPPGNFAL